MGRNEYTWKKGQSGNPRGKKKKGQTLTEILKKFGSKKEVEINGKTYTRNEALSIILWDKAIRERDRKSIEYIFNRIDGLPTQPMDIDGDFTGIKPDKIIINNTDNRMDRIIEILDTVKGIKKRGTKKGDNS